MSLIIQVTTIDGRVLESLRRSIDPKADFCEGHTVQLAFATKEKGVATFITKLGRQSDCSVEKEMGKDEYSVIVSLSVRQVRHLVDLASGSVESLAVLAPTSRTAEAIMTYLVDPSMCDPRVRNSMKGGRPES